MKLLRINSTDPRCNASLKMPFWGRVDISKDFFPKLINRIGDFEKQKIERELSIEEQKKKTIISWVKKIFFPKKVKTLESIWKKALSNLNNSMAKLSNEYILICRKDDLCSSSITFNIVKGKERIYGISGNLGNPKLLTEDIKSTVEKIIKGQSLWE